MLYKNLDPYINQNLVLFKNTHLYNTRHSAKSNYVFVRELTEMGKKSLSFIGKKIWQNVTQELKSHTLNTLKRKLKLYTIAKYLCE